MRLWISACTLLLLSLTSSSGQQKPTVTGFFTNMRYIPEAGDVLGDSVWIVYARGHFYAAIQDAEGEPDPPVVVPVEVSGLRVKFTVKIPMDGSILQPPPDVVTHYTGAATNAGLMLSIEGNRPALLKRQNWQ
jgi:hypothetical protein